MAMIVLEQLTPRATILHNICKAHTTLKPMILMSEIKREEVMAVWFYANETPTNEIPTKEQVDAILKDLQKVDGVKSAVCQHFSEGNSTGLTIYFAE